MMSANSETTRDSVQQASPNPEFDFDWAIVGSGFGGSVAALRLTEKGYRVGVIERGRRYEDSDLPTSTAEIEKFVWAPEQGLYGILRDVAYQHVETASQTGVGGGSLMYGGVLFRAQQGFYNDSQWRDLAPWESVLDAHYAKAEFMLGVRESPWDSVSIQLTKRIGEHFGVSDGFKLAPTGVFFGEPGKTVDDPYFGGEGPARTGCIRCGDCMIGCRTGAANRLTKNYLWFAEKSGARIIPEQEVIDVRPLGAADGADGYQLVVEQRSPDGARARTEYTARGVVFAGGAVATNELLADCKYRGSLPRISDRLGHLVRTNSETFLSVQFPQDLEAWRDVTAPSRLLFDGDTQVELLTVGKHADAWQGKFTVLTGKGNILVRRIKWLTNVVLHPRRWKATKQSEGWSARSLAMLVMQPRDNAVRLRAQKRSGGNGYTLVSEIDKSRPAPTFLGVGHKVVKWLAEETGGVAGSTLTEAFRNAPWTAHILGGAVIGSNATTGVIDAGLKVFGYENMIVCDAAALPANPGVNPALTITALAEYAMDRLPSAPAPAPETEDR
ncbi:GMC family oxidoreductase [Paraburkholderia sp. CNPSo 3076]|uniref:GMC oxidoreductase n=2 Tax=unclassified Paraburkholderia TaxID=2615204 RepID=UPI002259EF84|nr:GMC family oxidoreductase [Paraburkholderia sp. CNPSo 3076]MCX5540070.1 GMC family oxidoreductase [Paraburkholderia sp. CNPSo 3076]